MGRDVTPVVRDFSLICISEHEHVFLTLGNVLQRTIGIGGHATVIEATIGTRHVALKLMEELKAASRFDQEMAVVRQRRFANI